jgi:tetratricopeptide (TPR) repeat protein
MLRSHLEFPNRVQVGVNGKSPETIRKRIPEALLRQLKADIGCRRIDSGIRALDSHRDLLLACGPNVPNSAVFLGYVAQWVDIGFDQPSIVKTLLARFDQVSRESLSVLEYVHLHIAEAFVSLSEEKHDKSVRELETVLSFEHEIKDKQLIAIVEFWIGRCRRRQGRYQDALPHIIKARQMMSELKCPQMAAVMQVLEGWVIFQEGNANEALRILGEAESVLMETDDYVTRGNINSAYGRIARRQGQYDQALSRFAVAIEEHKKRNAYHHNLARSLVNTAFVKRLFALQLRNKIDRETENRRKYRRDSPPSDAHIHPRKYLERLREEAFEHLDEASSIYSRMDDQRGLGNAYITRGYLYLDNGELDRAATDGTRAHDLGVMKKDDVLQARSRVLQALVECAKIEEQIEDGESSNAQSSLLAYEFARDAVTHAKCTQNRRLTAKSHIALGLAICSSAPDEMETAWECCDQATALLNPENKDYVWRCLLQSLKNKLRNEGHIDSSLREWSQGIVGNKTFQQVSHEFENIVIPRVWKREGRRISHVAARLSISPKKVRRILRSQGLLTAEDRGSKRTRRAVRRSENLTSQNRSPELDVRIDVSKHDRRSA